MDPSILLLIVTVGLLVMLMTSQRRRQREQQNVQARLEPGSEVMTSSGLYATVVSVDDAVVVLETAPGQTSRWDRRAVVRVVTAAVDAGDEGVGGAPAHDEQDLEDRGPDDTGHRDDAGDLTHEEPRASASGADEPAGRDDAGGQAPGDASPERR